MSVLFACAPTGIRTPVLTLKGSRPGPLDDGGGTIEAGGILSSHPVMVKHGFNFLMEALSGRRWGWRRFLLVFHALIDQGEHIHFFAVEENARAFNF